MCISKRLQISCAQHLCVLLYFILLVVSSLPGMSCWLLTCFLLKSDPHERQKRSSSLLLLIVKGISHLDFSEPCQTFKSGHLKTFSAITSQL